ncbi:MAG: hypothetical protein ACOCQP_00325 [Lentisphaeria bacterium]
MSKMIKKIQILTILTFIPVMLAYGEEKPYIMESDDNKIEGEDISADEDGNIKLTREGGASQTFRRGRYEYAFTPKPGEVEELEKALENENYDKILDQASDVFDDYKYLGWAAVIGAIESEAYLADDDPEQALRTIDYAEKFAQLHTARLREVKAKALLAAGDLKEAEEVAQKLKKDDDDERAAFAFNVTGDILQEQGKEREAVLEYLKTLLVVAPQEDQRAHQEAREKVIALMKKLGDDRYKQFEN